MKTSRLIQHYSQDSSAQHPAPSYLSALRAIEETPPAVINLAATLQTPAEDETDNQNISFLRSTIDPQDEWRAQNAAAASHRAEELFEEVRNARERLRARTAELRAEDPEREERLQRIISRLSRIHNPAYSDRIPSHNSLYDWSPANEADDEHELREILQELRHQQPNTHSEILRVLARSQLESERQSRDSAYSSRFMASNNPSESSLRSTANLLQSARRHPRFSARSRDYMQRYITDRDQYSRAVHESDPTRPSRHSSSRTNMPELASSGPTPSRYERVQQAWQSRSGSSETQSHLENRVDRDIRARIDSYRRSYLENPSSASTPSPWMEEAINYLANLRWAESLDESFSYADHAGFVAKEFFGLNPDDFITNVYTIPKPAETSWLASGASFSGSQHATNVASTVSPGQVSSTTYRFRNNDSLTSTTFEPGRPWLSHTPGYVPPHLRRRGDNNDPASQQDRWPVKVTIHAVDYEKCTLAATMEAYNVPSHPPSYNPGVIRNDAAAALNPSSGGGLPSSNSNQNGETRQRTSSITTFLEGEILDFSNHTLLTESFKSTSQNDATYWRKLPPFSRFSTDEELVRYLLSKRFLHHLNQEWIFMRWKERCFVKNKAQHRSSQSPGSSFTTFGSSFASLVNPSFDLSAERERTWDLADLPNSASNANGAADGEDAGMDMDGCGLTISGFYYVCLRRRDGAVEGLYFDPHSTPYQCLRLNPSACGRGGVGGVWAFR